MAVAGAAFQMRVELEIVHRQLAMAFEEAGGDGAAAQRAPDAERDLRLVGALHQHAAPLGLDHRGVVEADALLPRQRRLAVRIDGGDLQQRVAPRHHLQQVAGAPAFGILAAVEIGQGDLGAQVLDGAQRGRGRRVGLLPRQVDMDVVERQRDARQHGDAETGQDDGGGIEPPAPGAAAHLQRQAQPGGKEQQQGEHPAGRPQQRTPVVFAVFHAVSAVPGPAPSGTGRAG